MKMKPIDVKNDSSAEYNEESNEKDLILVQKSTKILLLRDMLLIGVKKFLL